MIKDKGLNEKDLKNVTDIIENNSSNKSKNESMVDLVTLKNTLNGLSLDLYFLADLLEKKKINKH